MKTYFIWASGFSMLLAIGCGKSEPQDSTAKMKTVTIQIDGFPIKNGVI